MKAYLLKKHGNPFVLKMEDAPDPIPIKNEVRVKLKHIGINYAEILSRKGLYGWAPQKPYIPGMEGFGEIDSIGDEVTKYKVGDNVIIGAQFGSYAEKMVIPEGQALKPFAHLTDIENTAIAVNGLTAWVALMNLARLKKTDKVLIQAAGGGVGTMAVQIAKAFGNTVYGTAGSDKKLELLSQLGINIGINYRKDDFANVIKSKTNNGVDVVLEMVGGDVYKKSVDLLNPFGRIMIMGFAGLDLKKWNPYSWYKTWNDLPKTKLSHLAENSYSVMASHLGYLLPNEKLLNSIWDDFSVFTNKHNLKPIVGHTFNFEDLPKAHKLMESRNSQGKIVINIF